MIANLSFFPIFHKSGSEMLKIVLKRMKMSEISGGLRPLDPHRGLQPLDPACGGSAPYTPAGAAPLDPDCGGFHPPHTPADRGLRPWPRTPRDLLGRRPSAVPDAQPLGAPSVV